MIVDTSALTAIAKLEPGHELILECLLTERGLVPAPVLVEFERVVAMGGNRRNPDAISLLQDVLAGRIDIAAFTMEDASEAVLANEKWGTGNKRGGALNLLDLMVYAAARRRGLPILCTGRDFAVTDALIHPASRVG